MVVSAATLLRLLLVACPGEARDRYAAELESLKIQGVCFDTACTLDELRRALAETRYSGVLLDVPTLIRSSEAEKSLVNKVLEVFPALHLSYDPDDACIRSMFYGPGERVAHSMATFVETEASRFQARTFRRNRRLDMAWSVALASAAEPDKEERAVIVNLSPDGCFIITASDWHEGQELLLRLPALSDQEPIRSVCRRIVPWGEGRRLPGIGVRFETMNNAQRQEIEAELASERTGEQR
jgi:Tfp pilus assembly protein PilZ